MILVDNNNPGCEQEIALQFGLQHKPAYLANSYDEHIQGKIMITCQVVYEEPTNGKVACATKLGMFFQDLLGEMSISPGQGRSPLYTLPCHDQLTLTTFTGKRLHLESSPWAWYRVLSSVTNDAEGHSQSGTVGISLSCWPSMPRESATHRLLQCDQTQPKKKREKKSLWIAPA